MLAYLDALCAALLARNTIEIVRLLGLPAARELPRAVREEATAIARGGPTGHRAPINALHLYYKLSHLVGEETDTRAGDTEPARGTIQMEIPFRARKVG